jgi:hypothetical protein
LLLPILALLPFFHSSAMTINILTKPDFTKQTMASIVIVIDTFQCNSFDERVRAKHRYPQMSLIKPQFCMQWKVSIHLQSAYARHFAVILFSCYTVRETRVKVSQQVFVMQVLVSLASPPITILEINRNWCATTSTNTASTNTHRLPLPLTKYSWYSFLLEAPRFLDNRHMKVVRLSALYTGCLYPPGNIPGTHFCYRLPDF